MLAFVTSQILGLDGLVNLSNIVFLVAFSVRDVFWLRVLSVVSELIILPYYYFQREALWPPMFWGAAFMTVNVVRIVALALEKRPVVLSDQEEELCRLAFSSIERREFLQLATLARWTSCFTGEVLIEKGQQVPDAIVLISGEIEAVLNGKTIIAFRPGQLIGDAGAYSGLPCPMDVVARGPGTLARWDLRLLRELTESKPELRAELQQIVSSDLSAKLRDLAATASGFAGWGIEPGLDSNSK